MLTFLRRISGCGKLCRSLATLTDASVNKTAVSSKQKFLLAPLEPSGAAESYIALTKKVKTVGNRLRRPLSLAEKVLYAHLADHEQELERGFSQLELKPKRVALHDANAQLALLQFISTCLPRVRIPTSVHTDHLITARNGANADLEQAKRVNREVYDFLQSACEKYGIAYWKPGAGILHQIIFEQYAYPGGFMIGTDSHTPNAAGLGMLAIGCGGMEAVDVMAGATYEVIHPKIIGVHLKGKLSGWASAKGGTGYIIEYHGAGVDTLSATGMATIGNMGAEVGATSSVFPYTQSMGEYLRLTGRTEIAEAAERDGRWYLQKDEEAEYDRHIEIDLADLEPHLNGPFTPDLSHSISQLSAAASRNPTWPSDLSAVLIGSCTNSSYEDFSRSASLIKQASEAGLRPSIPLLIAPGSEEIRGTLERDGLLDIFTQEAGGQLLANACGACVGQWDRVDVARGKKNSIVSTFNRPFIGRHDGNPATHSYVSNPEIVTAMAYGGTLHFNPLTDALPLPDGKTFRFSSPVGDVWPEAGYKRSLEYYQPPCDDGLDVGLQLDPKSDRIQLIEPFAEWDGRDKQKVELLIKVKGKCTTDHISAAGPWYKYRGHLQNISENLLIGAVNAENDKVNRVRNHLTGEDGTVPSVAKSYRDTGRKWIIVGDDNYGEGSSREVAAMSPRYMGCFAVIAKSMARIHETNLKRHGVLPAFFVNKADYDKVNGYRSMEIQNLAALEQGSPLTLRLYGHQDGREEDIFVPLSHSLTSREIEWFKAGSALNALRQEARDAAQEAVSPDVSD